MKNKETVKKASGRAKFYVEKTSIWVKAAVVLMIMSAVFRLIGCIGLFGDSYFAVTQIALPLACNLLFILIVLTMGGRFFFMTSLPVLCGVVFFILKALTFDSWLHTLLCMVLYVLVAVLYTATAFGFIRTKWLLVPLFALPFLYHVLIEDVAAIKNNTMSFAGGMQEMSVLCIMLSLLCIAFAMKKRKPLIEGELPKIKDPKVIVPEKQAEPAAAPAESEQSAQNNDTGDLNETE